MDSIKIYSKAKKWLDAYLGHIKDCLCMDDNLSDIPDKQVARENLELAGKNIINHKHDSHYIPLIDAETADRTADDNMVLATIATKTANHENAIKSASNQIMTTQNNVNNTIASVGQTLFDMENNIQNNINSLIQKSSLNLLTASVSGSIIDEYSFTLSSECSGNWSKTSFWAKKEDTVLNTYKTIGSTTTTLADLIEQLVKCSHTHKTTTVTSECFSKDYSGPSVCLPGH